MEIIIITILSTILGLCLVALLVWLSIWSIRLMRFSKKAEDSIKNVEKLIESYHKETYDIIDNQINVLHNRINDEIGSVGTHVTELHSKIDSRCDKLWDDYNNRFIKMHGDNGFVFSKLDDEIKKMNEKVEYSNNRWMSHRD